MALRHAIPLQFSPEGLSDALDSTNIFPGAMAVLRNLIPDPTTKNLWQCRPASIAQTTFSGFSSPAFISALKVIGTRAYGMIASSLNTGKDQPFIFDLVSQSFVTITGITNGNTPTSPGSSGAWTPPTMDLVGSKLLVTHPGFPGTGGIFFGWFDLSNPGAPVWNAGNTGGTALPAVPTAVKAFNGRAYFLVNPAASQPAAYYTDVLNGTNITNANQILTFDDNTPLTAIGALPLSNQLGGIIQALIVFKSASNMYQITGDAALNNLAVNSLNSATGTFSPNSICATPKGLAFVSPDGMRLVDFNARVSDPIGNAGKGVVTPFIFSNVPSRVSAACNASVLRVSVQNNFAVGSPQQEYWYDIPRGVWSGPHDFPASLIQPFGNTFVMTGIGINNTLFTSDVVQSSSSTFVENGVQMTFDWRTSMLPDTKQMAEFAMVEATLNMALPSNTSITVLCGNQNGSLDTVLVAAAGGGQTIWGGFQWGGALWQGQTGILAPQQLPWHSPIVFRRLFLEATGQSAQSIQIGDLFMRYQKLGFLQQSGGA